jgi:serine/threonine-protein kinase
MKMLRGNSLASLVARGALPPHDIRRTMIAVGRALAYAHKSDIVHRDIKPDNIMFDEHGLAVVTDFGIAKAASGGKLTGTGMAIGTPHYMSPEQARAQPLDGRSDLYSLGVVAYQCLSGELPFDGEDSFAIGYKHIMEEVPLPHLLSSEQRDLYEVVKKLMAKRPEERFQDADAMVAALESSSRYVATGISTAPTRTAPGVAPPAGAARERFASQPTTPVPGLPGLRSGGRPAIRRPSRTPGLAGVLAWVLLVGGVLGAGAYFAATQGLLEPLLSSNSANPAGEAVPEPPPRVDSAALDTGAAATPGPPDSAPELVPAGTPGRLQLDNVPQGARITINGQLIRGTVFDLPPGAHALAVRATGYRPYDRQVIITPGNPSIVRVDLELVGDHADAGHGPCAQYGPEYNRGNVCFDTRPTPLSATVIPLPGDVPLVPRQAILLILVGPEGETREARVFGPSNVETFNSQALDMARVLRWEPAAKDGKPVEAWVQWPFRPVRQ